ncbi:MAG: mevalonate kinase [Thermoflexales bacterium]|nr:mevalonate kinase [Thermoflexales bacterium]MCS7324729.1 mevalonate kinase [Thermoflexales bacterium]
MAEAVARSACGKVILCGEHAVVYGRPAIALPLPSLRATATVHPAASALRILALDLGQVVDLETAPADEPLAHIVRLTLAHIGQSAPQATITVRSVIPIGANLGSGAAVSIAIARALAAFLGYELTADEASALAFEVEKLHHGTPSGVDNTVIAHECPVWFVRGAPPTLLDVSATHDLPLVVADTGIVTPTRVPVGDVRAAWKRDPARYEAIFDAIATQVHRARAALLARDWHELGAAMNANHALLQALNVSCPELDALCEAARAAGALGAKMSGGGRGGNMIALAASREDAQQLAKALLRAGAKRAFCA